MGADIIFGCEMGYDFLAASFVRCKEDILEVVTSALVGLGFFIMDSNIWVAVITCFPCSSANFIIFFCNTGTNVHPD